MKHVIGILCLFSLIILPACRVGSQLPSLTTPSYCWYNNNITYKDPYGALYNWYTVNTGKLCPTGWHVPSNDEWQVLCNFLGGDSVAGRKMKEAGYTHWQWNSEQTNNFSGFTAVGAGGFDFGSFSELRLSTYFWTPNINSNGDVNIRVFLNGYKLLLSNSIKDRGYSVRCLKDF